MMRAASALLVAVLMTTCTISGTFAKYVTEASSQDEARVAYWGFQTTNAMDIPGLFDDVYDDEGNGTYEVDSADDADVIAPGTWGEASFQFKYDETVADAPEVAYTFTVDTTGSECAADLQSNTNIQWKLDTGAWGTWAQLINSIKLLSGDASGSMEYKPGVLPAAFGTGDPTHTVSWRWAFDKNDTVITATDKDDADTALGNKASLDKVKLVIAITATQIDEIAP